MVDVHAEPVGLEPSAPAVLIVNDRLSARVAIRSMLTALGVPIVEADSGRAALRAVFAADFAVILMDVRMPGMDGYETADLIRQRPSSSRTPIIFVTAFGASDGVDTVGAYARGAVDFLFTPLVPAVLQAKVAAFVEMFVQSEKLKRSLQSITTLNAAFQDSEARAHVVLDHVADGIVTADDRGLIESFNPSAQALFGYGESEAIGQPFTRMIAPGHRAEFIDRRKNPRRSSAGIPGRGGAIETLGCRQDGSTFVMEIEPSEVLIGDRTLTLAFARDVSEHKAYTESLEHLALHDSLTGLANRTLLGEHLFHAVAVARRNSEPQAVLVLDLDGFKHVNDSHGHDHGDALLEQVAERLVGVLRETDKLARLGGDEFAILPEANTDLAGAATIAWKIQQIFKPGFTVEKEVVDVSASIGIALYPDHGRTPAELLQRADMAMYVAKKSGTGYAVFDSAQETQVARKLALMGDLRHCIAREELVAHYQPEIDLRTRKISGVETLIRWQHPERGLLSPGTFMPEVERTELIEPVTRWVLNEALRQQQVWRTQGIDLAIAVNIAAHSLRPSCNLPEIVAELIQVWDTAPNRLTLELTEGALIEKHAPEILGRLHALGVLISIDDFGTGYSSLAYLQRLPVDELKIDRSFITHLSENTNDEVIVRAIIDLAHNLGLTVVAEGVEDEAALAQLTAYGCESVQGYLLGRPCSAEDLVSWLSESPYGAQLVLDG